MTWKEKCEMIRLFNNRQCEEAVALFGQQQDWDEQAVDMFVKAMDLTKAELCLPIEDRIQALSVKMLSNFRSKLRLIMLQCELEKLKEKEQR